MNVMFPITLLCASGLMMILESRGLKTTLTLSFKGDVKRETRWLAQYGQLVCTLVVGVLMAQLDPAPDRLKRGGFVILVVIGTSLLAFVIKRLLSRVRPGRENAGKFLGPSWKHANYKESFPSSHSACAAALSVLLSIYYPHGLITFWTLAVLCGGLRYLMDAHWPSDVLGGLALGYACAVAAAHAVRLV